MGLAIAVTSLIIGAGLLVIQGLQEQSKHHAEQRKRKERRRKRQQSKEN